MPCHWKLIWGPSVFHLLQPKRFKHQKKILHQLEIVMGHPCTIFHRDATTRYCRGPVSSHSTKYLSGIDAHDPTVTGAFAWEARVSSRSAAVQICKGSGFRFHEDNPEEKRERERESLMCIYRYIDTITCIYIYTHMIEHTHIDIQPITIYKCHTYAYTPIIQKEKTASLIRPAENCHCGIPQVQLSMIHGLKKSLYNKIQKV